MKQALPRQQLQMAADAIRAGNYVQAKNIVSPLHQTHPYDPEVNWLLSDIFVAEGFYAEAARLLQKLAKRKSGQVKPVPLLQKASSICAHNDINALGLECARDWVKVAPKSEDSRFFLGLFLSRSNRYCAAIEMFQNLAREGSRNAWVYRYMAEAQMFTGQHERALENFEKGIALAPEEANFRANFLYSTNAMPLLDDARVSQEHLDYGRQQERKFKPLKHAPPASRPERLKIGFVSGEFRCHSITYFFLPLLKGLDITRYDVYCYSDTEVEDSFTGQIKALCGHWRETRNMASESVLKQVRDDGIDILVDLNGYTGKFRFDLFAQKAAPVQLSYLGYPNTTGLSRIDYRLTDEWADPEAFGNDFYSERLMRLPGGFLCFEPDPEAPSPELAQHPEPYVRFGSFNAFQKVNDAVIASWAEVLERVENSTLLFKSFSFKEPEVRRTLQKKFEALGVSAKRLHLLDHTPSRREHLKLYGKVDIHLDTFPYNGTTTTCEALWQGVPTVTFKGHSHRSRVGNSILHQVGLSHFIAEDRKGYVETAVEQAADLSALRAGREQLRERMQASPLMSVQRFAKEFSDALESMYQNYCEGASGQKET